MSIRTALKRNQGFYRLVSTLRNPWLRRANAPFQLALDNLGRFVSEDIVLKVDEFDGVFALSPRSHLLWRLLKTGAYEPELAALYRSHIVPERDILDIGANIGFFTIAGAKALTSGRVLAAEPTAAAYARLQANIGRNGVGDRIIVFNGLVSDQSGTATINSVMGLEEYSSIGPIVHTNALERPTLSEVVPVRTIDEMVIAFGLDPALIKVDVEGAEGRVFAGARVTLETNRPVVISELSNNLLKAQGYHGRDIVRSFQELDYDVVDPMDHGATPGAADFGDILCVPRERR